MAGDLDIAPLSPVKSYLGGEAQKESKILQEEPRLDPVGFEKPDSSEDKRDAFAEAISQKPEQPQGKLVIERDKDTGKYVQKVVDPNSGEVLKQWPEEQFLELARQMGEAYGLLVDRNV